jgi:hypothetical protein
VARLVFRAVFGVLDRRAAFAVRGASPAHLRSLPSRHERVRLQARA